MKHFRSKARNHEALAIDRRVDLLDLLMGSAPKENETIGSAIVVHVCGPLEHRACGYGDSYEQIRARFEMAIEEAPEAIILRIDSPGGVVAGLNEFVESLIATKERAGIPVYAYADELVASAAYALACVADEIITPASGIVGSIGVIALLCDQVEADKKAGLNFVTITSGARKDDGHPHTTISDDAIAAESKRVDALAEQFFDLVRNARGFDPAPLEAGVFTGQEAVDVGVADYVMGWDDVVAQFALAPSGTRVSASSALAQPGATSAQGSPMLKLKNLIAAKRAALKSAKGTAKASLNSEIASLELALSLMSSAAPKAAYKKTTKTETKEEKTDDEEDDKDEDAEHEEPDGDEKESAEGDDEKESAEDDDSDKDAKMADEDEEDDEPKKDAKRGQSAALAVKAAAHDKLAAEVAELRAAAVKREKNELIDAALAGRRITKAHAKTLRTEKLAFVKSYLKMHTKALYNREGDELSPDGTSLDQPFETKKISDQQMAMFQAAAAASGVPLKKLIENYQNADPARLNGKGA